VRPGEALISLAHVVVGVEVEDAEIGVELGGRGDGPVGRGVIAADDATSFPFAMRARACSRTSALTRRLAAVDGSELPFKRLAARLDDSAGRGQRTLVEGLDGPRSAAA